MFIPRRNPAWPIAAGAFSRRTVVFTATASKSARITPRPTSSANGANAAALRAIIFSNVL
jgi:hypothetical protein